jgi:NTP pyrophosphatase (non-canonical NTP hydrolase)
MISDSLKNSILKFRADRDWEQFHSPRSLAAAISIEAAELLEPFRWARDAEVAEVADTKRAELAEEVADLVILITYFATDLSIDLDAAVKDKLAKNELKYPTDKFRGSSRKYSEEGPSS